MSNPYRDEHHEFTLRRERGISVTVSCDADANIEHIMEAFKSYLLAVGFSSETVATAMGETQ